MKTLLKKIYKQLSKKCRKTISNMLRRRDLFWDNNDEKESFLYFIDEDPDYIENLLDIDIWIRYQEKRIDIVESLYLFAKKDFCENFKISNGSNIFDYVDIEKYRDHLFEYDLDSHKLSSGNYAIFDRNV